MFTYQSRQSPFFYLPSYSYQNCQVRSQPTYTPTSCSCFRAPCDCVAVLNDYRNSCSYNNTIRITTSTTVKDSTNGYNKNPPLLFLSITGIDAEALFNSLEIKTEKHSKAQIRTGLNVKCSKSSDSKTKTDEYACDFDVEKATGTVYQQSLPGDSTSSDKDDSNAKPYYGPNVTITADGKATIMIQGKASVDLFEKLNASASDAKLPTDPVTPAKVKSLKNLTCYQSVARHPITECYVSVNAKTGEVADSSELKLAEQN